MLVSAHITAKATPEPINFMSTDGAGMLTLPMFGQYDFDLANKTSNWVLNGFFTKQNNKWSGNWLKSGSLAPGKFRHMMWSTSSDSGACVVPFKATWDHYDHAEVYTVDWCKGISKITMTDGGYIPTYK
jgi:hypothetical protein